MSKSGNGSKPKFYADIHLHDNAVETVINTAGVPHLVQGLFSVADPSGIKPLIKGFTFLAGSTGAITDTANNGGVLRITSVAHGLTTGTILTTTGLTTLAQNNITNVTVIDDDTFDCDDIAFATASETGIWYEGDRVVADQGTSGCFALKFHSFGFSPSVNKTFEFEIFKNAVHQEHLEAKRRYSSNDLGVIGGGGLIEIVPGDIITFAIFGFTDTANFTMEHANISLHII